MGLEISKTLSIGGIQPYINLNRSKYINFGNSTDSVEIISNERYTTEQAIRKMITQNPKIAKITKNFNPDLNLNMKDLEILLKKHATDTGKIANGIIDNLPYSLKIKADKKAVNDAAYLHDLGKVLIPPEILNKSSKLDVNETKIMHTHSELSYELLKNTGLNEKTLKLIRNHHQNQKKSGYPFVDNTFKADLNLQVLSIADKYSALTENRTYKNPINPQHALAIIYEDVKEGKLHPFVFKALVNYTKKMPDKNLKHAV